MTAEERERKNRKAMTAAEDAYLEPPDDEEEAEEDDVNEPDEPDTDQEIDDYNADHGTDY